MSGSVKLKSLVSYSGQFFLFEFIEADFSDAAEVADSITAEDKAEYL